MVMFSLGALLAAMLRVLWLQINGALTTPPPLINGCRSFRNDWFYSCTSTAGLFALIFLALRKELVPGVAHEPVNMFFALLLVPFALLSLVAPAVRITLNADTITVRIFGWVQRSAALDDVTGVGHKRISGNGRINGRWSLPINLMEVRVNGKPWRLLPPMMLGRDWLFAHLQARSAENAAP